MGRTTGYLNNTGYVNADVSKHKGEDVARILNLAVEKLAITAGDMPVTGLKIIGDKLLP